MSNVRQQLGTAKAAYNELKYPGNLAAEMIFKHTGTSCWLIRIAGVGAVAAMLAVAMVLHSRPGRAKPDGSGSVATTLRTPPAQEAAAETRISFELPGMPQLPEGMSIVPSAQSIAEMPGMPLMPSLSTIEAALQEPRSTTQEAL